jgi:uncharacterized protein YjbJ (UPF0337 family)
MDKNRVEGKARQVKGAIKDAAGGLTGNTSMQAGGKIDKVVGKAQEGVGRVKDEVRAESRRQDERRRGAP